MDARAPEQDPIARACMGGLLLARRLPVTGIPAWLTVMFALEVAGTLDVSDTARIYAREAEVGGGAAIDVENVPRLAVGLDWPSTSVQAEYLPRLFWSDVGGPEASPTLLLHQGALRLTTREERVTASIAQTVAIGDQSFARLSFERGLLTPDGEPARSPELELVPSLSVVRIAAAETSASLRYEWSRRVSTELRPSFGIAGGADAAAKQVLPRQRTARIDTSLDYRSSRRDTLTTDLGVADTSVSNGYDHRVVALVETWSRTFASESGGALGAGVALQESTGPAIASETDWQPIGRARVWHALLARAMQIRLQAELGYQPHVNAITGTLQRRLYGSAEASATAGDTSGRLVLGAAQTFPLEQPDTSQSISADLVVEQALLDWLSAEVGGQLVFQTFGRADLLAASDSLWLVFAGARGELPSVRF